jgi:hypothetical protein
VHNFDPLMYLFAYLKNFNFAYFINLYLVSEIDKEFGCYLHNYNLELVSEFIVFCNLVFSMNFQFAISTLKMYS